MRRLIYVYVVALVACVLLTAGHAATMAPGLSITMGTAISSMYSSTVLGSMYSTMLGSTVYSTVLSTIMISSDMPFKNALTVNQIILPIVASMILCFVELARSSYGSVPVKLERASKNLTSEVALLTILCLVFLFASLYYQARGLFW